MDNKYEFFLGALPPKHLEWQIGRTAGEIVSVNLLMRAREIFIKESERNVYPNSDIENLIQDINKQLIFIGVEK